MHYHLASAWIISNFKHMPASQVEQDAALALLTKVCPVKSTLHYDTTSRNSTDDEKPSIILHFLDGREFILHPMFFAYEDREQIIEPLIETFKCLAVAASIYKEEEVKPITVGMYGCIHDRCSIKKPENS